MHVLAMHADGQGFVVLTTHNEAKADATAKKYREANKSARVVVAVEVREVLEEVDFPEILNGDDDPGNPDAGKALDPKTNPFKPEGPLARR
jgi:hypothetical protein